MSLHVSSNKEPPLSEENEQQLWRPDEKTQVRFWQKVNWSAEEQDPDGCWLWTAASRDSDHIGVFGYAGKVMYAHRMAFLIARGQIPPGAEVRRTCMNSKCVRPLHLSLVGPGAPREEPAQPERWLL